jgi:hypothetical protein
MTEQTTKDWLRAEIRRLDSLCKRASTKSAKWYCMGKRAGFRLALAKMCGHAGYTRWVRAGEAR